jgi:hypothetical protein
MLHIVPAKSTPSFTVRKTTGLQVYEDHKRGCSLCKLVYSVTFFLLITVHITDYHWDRHLYFVIHPHHAQTMTHTPPSDDSILVLLLLVLAACDSN